jgi:N4-gp56 family major capsid protein
VAATTSAQLAADLQTYFSKVLLKQAKYKTILDQFGYVENIPSNSSKTISFTQYTDLTPVAAVLTEGTPPTDTQLATTAITATIDQLGAYVTLTDLAKLTPKHPVMQKTLELLGVQGARTYDNYIFAAISAGTGVYYAGGVASRATITTTSYMTFSDVFKAVANQRQSGAEEFDDGNFVLAIDPKVELDLLQDTTFQNVVYRQLPNDPGKNELYKGKITTFGGVTIVRSNQLGNDTVLGGVGGAIPIHFSFVFGQNAYAVTNLQNMQTYTQGPGSVSDPLEQKMTVGWKFGFKSVILNNNFFNRIESASRY